MAYVGNLTCRDCGLTFTDQWGSTHGADEYRCLDNDHVVFVCPDTGTILGGPEMAPTERTLADLFGRCPACSSELVTGRLPRCPVCSSRDHDVSLAGVVG